MSPHFPTANHTFKKNKVSAGAIIAQIQLSFETRFLSLQIGLVTGLSFVKDNEVVYKRKGVCFSQRILLLLLLYFYISMKLIERSCIYFVVSCIKLSNLNFFSFPISGPEQWSCLSFYSSGGIYHLTVGT